MKKQGSFLFTENSLDVIRLIAALQIALTHYLNLTLLHYRQTGEEDMILLGVKRILTLFPGLIILFAISGFLMGATLERTRVKKDFARKRFLRIYPGMWVNIFLTLLLIMAVLKPEREGIRSLLAWLGVQAFGFAYTPAYLQDFGTGSINGTLWTIMVELQFYLLLFLLWNWIKKWKDASWHIILLLSIAINFGCGFYMEKQMIPENISSLLSRTFLPYLVWFILGMYIYHFRERMVPGLVKCCPGLLIIFIVYKGGMQYFSWNVPGYYMDIVTSLMLPCISIGCAYSFGRHRLKGDISYGIFLYHWPVINLIFYYALPQKINHLLLFGGYIVVFLLLANASWHLVESHFLKGRSA